MEKESEDDLISKKNFQRASGVNLDNFLVSTDNLEIKQDQPDVEEIVDEAMGEVPELFSKKDGNEPDENARKERDTITEYAVEGEKRLHFGLIISMIVVWSAIGTIVGLTLSPLLATAGLLLMAVFGLWLGEIWIPKDRMHILGVTWVIISMKLLYGLAISMYSWDWINQLELGLGLISLVVVNLIVAQRHDDDAIATQATIVLLAIGSAAGEPYGEQGVAIMIAIGTLLLHGLAYYRSSGNLASLGIAVSYLWIGIHAISDNWSIFGINIKPFEDDLLLFILMFGVTSINATTATKFAKEENWFSSAFNSMGLGKPGLWSVSVGLGMIGAMFAIASHRLETGYALAQLLLLIYAFAPSYLIVRGVEWNRLIPFTLWPAPILLAILILMVRGLIELPILDGYSLYAAISALLTIVIILNHQKSVSDHVLWIGAIVLVILLTLLVDASEYQGGRNLLILQSIVWVGLSWLSLQRESPSMAGTAVIVPWMWILFLAGNLESKIISNDLVPILISENDLAAYMLMLVLIQIPINLNLGESGANIAGRLVGLSELSARMRDGGYLKLWNLGFISSLFTIVMVAGPQILPATGLILVMAVLIISHSIVIFQDKHHGNPRVLLMAWGIGAIILQWRFGYSSIYISIISLCSILMMMPAERNFKEFMEGSKFSEEKILPDYLITTTFGLVSVMLLVFALDQPITNPLTHDTILPLGVENLRISSVAVLLAISILYLPRASKLEKLLPSAIMSLSLIVILAITANSFEDTSLMIATGIFFVICGAWLAAQGEIRSRMKEVSMREQRIQKFRETSEAKSEAMEQTDDESNIRMIDPELIRLAEKQKKRSKRMSSTGDYDMIVGDITHKPTIVVSFITVTMLFAIYLAWVSASSITSIAIASFISILLISIARWRAQQVNLNLPDIMGIESPVAISMAGLTLVQIAGRLGDKRVSLDYQWEILILLCALMILGFVSVIGRRDLGLRIPSVLEGIVILLVSSRILTSLMGLDQIQPSPFEFSANSWKVPVFSVEIFLILSVILFEWIESERIKRDLSDHRGAAGRMAWAAMIVIISFGIAGIIACILAIRNSLRWLQPGIIVGISILIPFSWHALSSWMDLISDTTSYFIIALGLLSIALSVFSVASKNQLWIASLLCSAHILIPSGSFGYYEQTSVLLMAMVVLLSCTSWLIGIITLRRTWRVIGAFDLVLSWIIAGFLVLGGASSSMILVMLLATAVLLGLVTWLGQMYEDEISDS